MNQGSEVKVRDKRRPGHCWQDNELYDAWQPIIGSEAVNIYTNLTRDAYSSAIEYSARRIADTTGISKSTVAREMKVMEHVGMVRLRLGAGAAASVCELLDLKEAAERLGAVYNRQRASFVFTDVTVARLRAEVTALRRAMRQPPHKPRPVCGDPGERQPAELVVMDAHVVMGPEMIDPLARCVPLGDTNAVDKSSEEKNLCPPCGDASVPVSGGLCPPAGGSQQKCEQNTIHNTNPPPAPSREREGDAAEDDSGDAPLCYAHIDDALEHVMRELGFPDDRSNARLKKALRAAMKLYMQRYTGRAYHAAEEMIGAWRDYCKLAKFLRFQWSPRKFFTEGHWLDPGSWPLDQARLRQARNARVGMG